MVSIFSFGHCTCYVLNLFVSCLLTNALKSLCGVSSLLIHTTFVHRCSRQTAGRWSGPAP